MGSLQSTRDVYGKNPPEPAGRGSSLPVIAAPVVAVVRSVDFYIAADHWRGMAPRYTQCRCRCHVHGGVVPDCGEATGDREPDWCNATPQE